jgi:predicted RecB family endonuclease
MSYPRLYDQLPTRRFATAFGGRAAAANYHGVRIARLLAVKMGLRPVDVLPFMARPLAREAARELGLSVNRVLADLAAETEENGGGHGR